MLKKNLFFGSKVNLIVKIDRKFGFKLTSKLFQYSLIIFLFVFNPNLKARSDLQPRQFGGTLDGQQQY